jgi:CheY-like chemotaxis protein
MYAEFLRHDGFSPICVSTAEDGLTQAPGASVIVCGILLHGQMNGIDLIAQLRRDDRTMRTPIVVLTACAWDADRRRAEQAGCDAFLTKPCLPEDLSREVRRLLAVPKLARIRGAAAQRTMPPVRPAATKRRR